MKITMDGKYRTRSGHSVVVHCIDGPNNTYPVIATTLGGMDAPIMYTLDGSRYVDETADHDLVEVTTTTYLKSIQQILEENPEAYFNLQGSLSDTVETSTIVISGRMFHLFGKKFGDNTEWDFHVSWKEEREDV